MKKLYYIAVPLVLVLGVCAYFGVSSNSDANAEQKMRKVERIRGGMEWIHSRRANPETGTYSIADHRAAVAQADALAANRINSRNDQDLVWEFMGPDNVGGRTRAFIVDRADDQHLFMGSVSGGLFESFNQGTTWQRVESCCDVNSISTMVQDPNNHDILYVGTGEEARGFTADKSGGGSNFAGNGIYKSTDGGATWFHLEATAATTYPSNSPTGWGAVQRIDINPANPDNLLAATLNGVRETFDGGETWSSSNSGDLSSNGEAEEVTFSIDGKWAYCNVGSGLYRRDNENNGAWEQLGTGNGLPAANRTRRTNIAVSPDPEFSNYVYFTITATNNCLTGLYKSTDNGLSFETAVPGGTNSIDPLGQDVNGSFSCQGDYDLDATVAPWDPNVVFVGGIVVFTLDGGNWNRVDQISSEGADIGNPLYIHADKHLFVFDHDNPEILYCLTDGGLHKTINARSGYPNPDWTHNNQDYNTIQFYNIDAGINGEMLGGAQDNGSNLLDFKQASQKATREVFGGDGAYAGISTLDPNFMFYESQNCNLFRSIDAGNTSSSFMTEIIDPGAEGQCENGFFINPFWLFETRNADERDEGDSVIFVADRDYATNDEFEVQSAHGDYNIKLNADAPIAAGDTVVAFDKTYSMFFLTTSSGFFATPNALSTRSLPSFRNIASRTNATAAVQAMDVSPDLDVAYVGQSNGDVYKISGLTVADFEEDLGPNRLSIPDGIDNERIRDGSGIVTGVSVSIHDENVILVTYGGYGTQSRVFLTEDGGNSWTDIHTPTLPNMPIYSGILDKNDENNECIVVGSELGLWASFDKGQTWVETNEGVGRIPVFTLIQEILYEEDCYMTYAGSHARGFLRSTSLTPSRCKTEVGFEHLPTSVENVYNPVAGLTVYPNPASITSNVEFEIAKASDVKVSVLDLYGKLVYSNVLPNVQPGKSITKIDVSTFAKGNYMVVVSAGETNNSSAMIAVQ